MLLEERGSSFLSAFWILHEIEEVLDRRDDGRAFDFFRAVKHALVVWLYQCDISAGRHRLQSQSIGQRRRVTQNVRCYPLISNSWGEPYRTRKAAEGKLRPDSPTGRCEFSFGLWNRLQRVVLASGAALDSIVLSHSLTMGRTASSSERRRKPPASASIHSRSERSFLTLAA